jgi:hypothetical protein
MNKTSSSVNQPAEQATGGVESVSFVAIHPIATRRSHNFIPSELVALIEGNRASWTKGDREGIFFCSIPKEWVNGEIMTLKEGESYDATITFSARKGVAEEARQEVKVKGIADAVHSADVILYSHDLLGKDASSEMEFEVIAIRGLTETPNPRPLSTLLHNIFNMSGGTQVEGTAEQLLAMIEESFLFWKDKVMVG